ncbi:MAG: oligosaccharide flippase family protein [Methylophaga sp.]|nr:oligosaccharide flippase family protein [Methylophaga sp.]
MTRLLVPEMFGLMAMVYVFMTGVSMLSDIGLRANIIQSKRGDTQLFLSTAWSVQVVRGFILFTILLIISGVLIMMVNSGLISEQSTYASPQLPLLIAVTATTAIISGFNSINLQLLNRNLQMARVTVIELVSQLTGILTMISIAIFWREVWVLVIAAIISASVKLYLSHRIIDGVKTRFMFDRESWNEIFNFGKWIFIGSVLGFLLNSGDRIILAGYLSPEMLGIYSIAFLLAGACRELFKKLINSVFFPAISEITRSDPKHAQKIYYKVRLRIDAITMSSAGFIMASGSAFILILYDERYYEAGWMLELLSVSLLFIGYSMAGMFLMARGNSKSYSVMIFVSVIFLFTLLPLSYHHFGLYGAILVIAFNQIVDIPVTFYYLKKEKLLVLKREFVMVPLFFISYFSTDFLLSLTSLNT